MTHTDRIDSLEERVERLELDLAEAISAIARLSVEVEKLNGGAYK